VLGAVADCKLVDTAQGWVCAVATNLCSGTVRALADCATGRVCQNYRRPARLARGVGAHGSREIPNFLVSSGRCCWLRGGASSPSAIEPAVELPSPGFVLAMAGQLRRCPGWGPSWLVAGCAGPSGATCECDGAGLGRRRFILWGNDSKDTGLVSSKNPRSRTARDLGHPVLFPALGWGSPVEI